MDSTDSTEHRSLVDKGFAFLGTLSIGDRFILKTTLGVFVLSLMWLVVSANAASLVEIPNRGGALHEGIVGTPRFVNPILAVTAADQDLTALIYAGLMKLGPDGTLVPDIAESVNISDDGRIYSVMLKQGLTFHDGTPLVSDDVIFTVSRIQDPATKSPLRASWEGVSVQRQNEREMQFVLTEPYEPFIDNLTLGIVPKHIWESVSAEALPFSQNNTEPIGAGPYMVSKISRNSAGLPESYELVPFETYSGEPAKIATLDIRFYPSEQEVVNGFNAKEIDSAGGLSGESIRTLAAASIPFALETTPLPRTFALFFNQNELPLLRDSAVRKALAAAVERDRIIEDVLDGYGEPISSPIPPGFKIDATVPEQGTGVAGLDRARTILRDGGWRVHEETGMWEKKDGDNTLVLQFSISTANTPVFNQTAELLKARWGELGVPVTIKQFEQSDLVQTVIRPRKYETLLFGTVVGRELDFFSFWHSSQRNDPGLNVALYANITTDTLLAHARVSASLEERTTLYKRFSDELTNDVPAIFLYVPTYTYLTPPAVHNISLTGIARGSERFSTISQWYIETDSVWTFFIAK